jgi:hypothetical protein
MRFSSKYKVEDVPFAVLIWTYIVTRLMETMTIKQVRKEDYFADGAI